MESNTSALVTTLLLCISLLRILVAGEAQQEPLSSSSRLHRSAVL